MRWKRDCFASQVYSCGGDFTIVFSFEYDVNDEFYSFFFVISIIQCSVDITEGNLYVEPIWKELFQGESRTQF